MDHQDAGNFELFWEEMSEEKKSELVLYAADFDPKTAILPVLKGLGSYHFSLRNNARKTLELMQDRIRDQLADPDDHQAVQQAMHASDHICCRLYSCLKPDLALNEQSIYLKLLMATKGKGAAYAYKALYLQRINLTAAMKIILTLPETDRLEFVDQFLQSSASVRLRFGKHFKQILTSIKEKDTVVRYYARLFDLKRHTDPFLQHIDPYLRDPEQIMLRQVRSGSAAVRVTGLKALSMIVPKVSPDLLEELINNDDSRQVRITIYKIISQSTQGTYPDLFYPTLEIMGKTDDTEKFFAFKALVAAGKLPLYTVLEIIRDSHPQLMPRIQHEILQLGRLAFLIIQDIALNKSHYIEKNLDVNRMCIFGLIRKRPERIVRILKQFDNVPDDPVRMGITRFIEKTKKLLAKEKQGIVTRFDPIIEQMEQIAGQNKGLIKSLFSSKTSKRLSQLKNNRDASRINFDGETVCNENLSSTVFLASALYFNDSAVINCDFSKSTFTHAYFKNCVFYNVNMRATVFDSVYFDNAVFINVNSKGARFNACSFNGVRMFNCNFNQAVMVQAPFIDSTIAKTSFNGTDLYGASFAWAAISAVSFVNSNIEHTDFSNVRSRFSRFPVSFRSLNRHRNIDYNARKYQLEFADLPEMTPQIISRINIELFSEFIHYGEMKFSWQNQVSLLTAFDIFKPRQAHLFHIIPYLLHENMAFPGIEEEFDLSTPCGIYDYLPGRETKTILAGYMPPGRIVSRRKAHAGIEGLFTIGSTGSMAQTADSDIDYWVCVSENKFSRQQMSLLQSKLAVLEKFALRQFKTQVTFFVVDIQKARNNDFGGSSLESSGSAQSRLLKEEFYRTMIHVAGKLPLWAVLPTAISVNYYNSILEGVFEHPNMGRYVDLGDIHAIPTSEYFGASIWQMFKWLKSPFKSVIKMALLEKYIYEYGKKPLLCNLYKDEWMNSGINLNLAQNDAYYILVNNLLDYFKRIRDKESVHILLTCFFLKLGISNDSQVENTVFGLRKILLEKCLESWNWERDVVFEIGSFKTWQYSEIARLSTMIEEYMIRKYKIVNNAFEKLYHGKSQISPEDQTVLSRKVYIEFSKQPGKVNKVLLISRSDRHFSGLHLKYHPRHNAPGTWQLINKSARAYHNQEESLINAKTIEEIGAWLIHNGLYTETGVINLVPNPTYVTFDDIKKLFKALNDYLAPVISKTVNFERLLEKNQVTHLFVSINFYAPRQQHKVTEYTAIYLNSWGEMYCKSVYMANGFTSLDAVKSDILTRVGIPKFPKETAFYFSKGAAR